MLDRRPQEIDEAARRRFVKRLYIPLPEADGRQHIVHNLLREQKHDLTDQQVPPPYRAIGRGGRVRGLASPEKFRSVLCELI